MIMFTKKNCTKCDYIKDHFNLSSFGIKEAVLSDTNADALADLAFYELVEAAEKMLPILVTDDEKKISGAVPISRFLKQGVH